MKQYSRLLALPLLLAIASLSGCATLSEGECRVADWYDVGQRDGVEGRSEDYILQHAKACGKYGQAPNRERWMDGRFVGLAQYCTVRNGFAVGNAGNGYGGVCRVRDEDAFLHGYGAGQELYRARTQLASIESDIHDAEHDLHADKPDDKERKKIAQRLRELEFEHGYARHAYDELEARSRELANL